MLSSFNTAFIVILMFSLTANTSGFAQFRHPSNNGAQDTNRRSSGLLYSSTMASPPSSSSSITIEKPVTEDEIMGTRASIVAIESAEDLKVFLEEGQEDPEERIAVLKFYAPWCKLCQRFGEQYKRIAREIGDLEEVTLNDETGEEEASVVRNGEVRMGEIDWSANSDLCKSLGVTKLPTVQVYSSKGKLVDSMRCGPNKFSTFLDKLDMYMTMDQAELDFEADMFVGARLGDNVLDALEKEIAASAAKQKSLMGV